MEFRIKDTIINIDKQLSEDDQKFVKGMAYLIEGVLSSSEKKKEKFKRVMLRVCLVLRKINREKE